MHHFPRPGQVFAGRYCIEQCLAQGGMGAVFSARHMMTKRSVAVKVLRPNLFVSERAKQQFEVEAGVSAWVESEHIVQCFDAGTDTQTGCPYLVMELLQGATVTRALQQLGRFSAEIVASIAHQVARGLDSAHRAHDPSGAERPIIHRDLKPDNLFLSRRPNGRIQVKILDFGLAKLLDESSLITQDRAGTPAYVAYEQLAGCSLTTRTDLWSFGLIAFAMLTGRMYWKSAHLPGGGLPQLYAEILHGPLVPASERALELGFEHELPTGFDEWFARCVCRSPSQRHQGAGVAAQALGQLLGVSAELDEDVALAAFLDRLEHGDSPAGTPRLGSTDSDTADPSRQTVPVTPLHSAGPALQTASSEPPRDPLVRPSSQGNSLIESAPVVPLTRRRHPVLLLAGFALSSLVLYWAVDSWRTPPQTVHYDTSEAAKQQPVQAHLVSRSLSSNRETPASPQDATPPEPTAQPPTDELASQKMASGKQPTKRGPRALPHAPQPFTQPQDAAKSAPEPSWDPYDGR